jgi:hypothetical protein
MVREHVACLGDGWPGRNQLPEETVEDVLHRFMSGFSTIGKSD